MSNKVLNFDEVKKKKEITEYLEKYLEPSVIEPLKDYFDQFNSLEELKKQINLDYDSIVNDLNKFIVSGCKIGLLQAIVTPEIIELFGSFLMNNTLLGNNSYIKPVNYITKKSIITVFTEDTFEDKEHPLYDESLKNDIPYIIPLSVVNGATILVRNELMKVSK